MVSAPTLTQPESLLSPLAKASARWVLVLFGASGDLTKRKLVPALFNLAKAKLLPDNFAVLGVAFDQLSVVVDVEVRSLSSLLKQAPMFGGALGQHEGPLGAVALGHAALRLALGGLRPLRACACASDS